MDSLSNPPTPLPLEVRAIEGALTLDNLVAVAVEILPEPNRRENRHSDRSQHRSEKKKFFGNLGINLRLRQ